MVRKRGFTLIEIMIVLAIIALLSVVLVPKVGAIKLQSKNKNVTTNVMLVRSYLENRSGKDGIQYKVITIGGKTQEQALDSILKSNNNDNTSYIGIGPDMTSNFSGSNALTNPFTSNNSIVYSQGNITNKSPSSTSSVLVYYSTGNLPSDNNSVINNSMMPKGVDFKGNVVIVVYSTGYVLYGVDNSGEMVNIYIIKFPPTPPIVKGGVTPGDGGDDGEDTNGNTIADLLATNCFNVLGDSSTQVNLGNSTTMSITGSVYLQGQQITLKQNSDINGNFSILGVGGQNSINIGNGSGQNQIVNGIVNFQAYNIDLNSNFQSNNNVSILANNKVNFGNSSINTSFSNGNVQIESDNEAIFSSDISLTNSKFSTISEGNVEFTNRGRNFNLDRNSSAYIQSKNDMDFYYKLDSKGPITMISTNNLDFGNNGQSININAGTYLKGNTVSINKNVAFGDTYIEANTFDYKNASIYTTSLKTYINNFIKGNSIYPNPVLVSAHQEPSEPAVQPTPITRITTPNQIKTTKSGIVHSNAYDVTTYNDLAFRVIRGSDNNALKQALAPTSENINPNIYKLLIIDGDCSIEGSINNWGTKDLVFNNFIIYCTGKMTFANNINSITFNNSAIITKNADTNAHFTMTQLSSNQYTENIKRKINNCFEKYFR
ncbi:prepilin-type N-terminal cleavage/methylation domain-containing protein [Clostridium sp. CX1]|uniref:prepilin-type N-terminal cleavage/methylation domain-containing protein n=1 Tax=Clostridium sp. CX1 TaxID=2978346 RepID=UPI0021BDFD12|nr:prepilin-type N-terminal cleavage/methylation domain-containing protein [Clostridium sp. CX1]MCT8976315.1 prepilin-type N-terminal cleavage/methylation domain-containing protein [Clostridium sp. CX1]